MPTAKSTKVVGAVLAASLLGNVILLSENVDATKKVEGYEDAVSSLIETVDNLQEETGNRTGTKVYITDNGTKYHKPNCSYLSGYDTAIDLYDARQQGYDACSRCF